MLAIFILYFACIPQSRGQGIVTFINRAPGLDAPVFGIDGVTPLAGAAYVAQLYAGFQGSSESSLSPVAEPAPFMTGVAAGYWELRIVEVPSILPGQTATVQVRVWETAAGSYEAAQAGAGLYGSSKLLDIELGDRMFGHPPWLWGLESFSLVPEPGTILLGALGLSLFIMVTRRPVGSRACQQTDDAPSDR